MFVCTNVREPGARVSCAGEGRCGAQLRDALKSEVAKRGWKGRVRVSASGCLDVCEDGPNVLIVPRSGETIHLSGVGAEHIKHILDEVLLRRLDVKR